MFSRPDIYEIIIKFDLRSIFSRCDGDYSLSFAAPGVNDAFLIARGSYWNPLARICVDFVRISQAGQRH